MVAIGEGAEGLRLKSVRNHFRAGSNALALRQGIEDATVARETLAFFMEPSDALLIEMEGEDCGFETCRDD